MKKPITIFIIGFIFAIFLILGIKTSYGYYLVIPQCHFKDIYIKPIFSSFSQQPAFRIGCWVSSPDTNGYKDYETYVTIYY